MSNEVVVKRGATAWWAWFVLSGGVLALALMAVGPLGYRSGVLGVSGAVILVPMIVVGLAAVTLLGALVGLFFTLRRRLTTERLPVLIGGSLALVLLINMAGQFMAARNNPIHDITTAPDDPPIFSAIVAERADAPNTLAYDASSLAAITRSKYPFVKPLMTPLAPQQAYERALAVVEELGWEMIPSADIERIEATDTTLFYGFKDDVVIRLRPEGGEGTRIDLRSVSRVGESDLGANAARIKAFLERY